MNKTYESRGVQTERLLSAREVFRVPIWLGIGSVFGLVSALVGDGVRDGVSWAAILMPVAAVWWAWRQGGSERRRVILACALVSISDDADIASAASSLDCGL